MQLGLLVERGAQAVQRLAEPVVTDVVEAGGRPAGREQIVGAERHERPPVVAETLAVGDEPVHPFGASGRSPRHGAAP